MNKELCKRYVLSNIEKYCDIDTLNQIEQITFWNLEYWADFRIDYFNWNADSYNFKDNVMPFINNIIT